MPNQLDAFLEIKEIPGGSLRKGYEKQIPLKSFSWHGANQSTIGVTEGGGAGKGSLSSLVVTKNIDESSPKFFQNCMEGVHLPKATLTVLKAGGKAPVDFIKYELEHVYISSVQFTGSSDAVEPDETVSIDFGKMTYTFTPQNADGTKGSAVIGSYSMKEVNA
jgi:type VI secretion system secreted protein Hcp